MLWARGGEDAAGECCTSRRERKPDQWRCQSLVRASTMVPRGKIPPEIPGNAHITHFLPRITLCHDFQGGAAPLLDIPSQREGSISNTHIYLHLSAYGHGAGTPYGQQMNPSALNSWVSCRINTWFPWKTLSFPIGRSCLCAREEVGRVLGLPSGVSPSPGDIPDLGMIMLLCPLWIPNPKCFLSMPDYLAVALGWDSRQA